MDSIEYHGLATGSKEAPRRYVAVVIAQDLCRAICGPVEARGDMGRHGGGNGLLSDHLWVLRIGVQVREQGA